MMIPKVVLRSAYSYDVDQVSDETGLECLDPSLTVQSEKEDADINTIVKRFGLTGSLPQGVKLPEYADYTDVSDFRSAVEAIDRANEAFMQFPWDVRARFENDPQQFMAFCTDTYEKDGKPVLRNLEEMRKLGLAVPVQEPAPAAVVAPVAPPA